MVYFYNVIQFNISICISETNDVTGGCNLTKKLKGEEIFPKMYTICICIFKRKLHFYTPPLPL